MTVAGVSPVGDGRCGGVRRAFVNSCSKRMRRSMAATRLRPPSPAPSRVRCVSSADHVNVAPPGSPGERITSVSPSYSKRSFRGDLRWAVAAGLDLGEVRTLDHQGVDQGAIGRHAIIGVRTHPQGVLVGDSGGIRPVGDGRCGGGRRDPPELVLEDKSEDRRRSELGLRPQQRQRETRVVRRPGERRPTRARLAHHERRPVVLERAMGAFPGGAVAAGSESRPVHTRGSPGCRPCCGPA